ncbi:epsin-3 [Pyxicephalus adspersus]|uniref:epsin-3 n=1 Tax=Pyxicephalus adspersus TaxID=30357 RepID=UPI003B5ACE14
MAASSFRRQVKNIVHNYSDAEVKVREATSNDPWGPSASLMSEIAQMTYSAEMYPEVMMMLWRRLNDSGKYWRHVHKGLTLMDYLIKNGSLKVVQECTENIMAVQTLKDFQYFDRDGRDQGINVREKAKVIVALLKDEEKIKQDRAMAQTTRRRMSQVTAALDSRHRLRYNEGSTLSTEIEQVRPQSSGEEELQLQLALAMSKEESEKKKEPSAPILEEELQLQAALNQSKEEYEKERKYHQGEISIIEKALRETQLSMEQGEPKPENKVEDLIDIFSPPQPSPSNILDTNHDNSFFSAWGPENEKSSVCASSLPWDLPHSTQFRADNRSQSIIFNCDPSSSGEPQKSQSTHNLFGDGQKGPIEPIYDIFTPVSPKDIKDTHSPSSIKTDNSFELDFFGDEPKPAAPSGDLRTEDHQSDSKPNPHESFLEPVVRNLVNLESLITYSPAIKARNPFVQSVGSQSVANPFQSGDLRPSLNQMRAASPGPNNISVQPPMPAVSSSSVINPFQYGDLGPSLNQMRTASPVPNNIPVQPPMPMPGNNTLRTLPSMPGFLMQPIAPMPLQPFPATTPPHLTMGYPYAPPSVTLPQQIYPSLPSQQAGNNPFL